jgi:hypothetical protein
VDSFDKTSRTYLHFSLSTKIPEYMGSARPIFAYGPEELASIQYISETGVGLTVGVQEFNKLVSTLRELCLSKSLRESLGMRGYQVASQRHNAAKQRLLFRNILESVSINND